MRKSARWLIFVPVAVFAFVSPANASTISDGFDNLNDWVIIRNGGNGVIANGVLRFSYQWGEVRRSILVSEPSMITVVSVVDNSQANSVGWGAAIADTYEIHVGTNSFVSNEIHGWRTVTVSFETTVEDEIVDISLAGIDHGFWAGWYGPSFDSIEIQIAPVETNETTTIVEESTTVLEQTTSTIQETTSSTVPISTTTLEAIEQTTTTETTLQTTTTEAIAVVPIPSPQTTEQVWIPPATTTSTTTTTSTIPETTTSVDSTTTTTATTTIPTTTTSSVAKTTTTTANPPATISPEAPVSLPVASENLIPVETTQPIFFSPETSIEPLVDAPDEVKKQFENETNIFDGSHDDYVPVGSTVSVAERRTIIAATTILMTLPAPVRRKT